MTKKLAASLIVAALVVGFVTGVVGDRRSGQVAGGAGPAIYGDLHLVGDFLNGLAGTKIVSGGQVVSAVNTSSSVNAGSLQLDGGTSFGELNCATSSWNPGSLASSSVDGVSATSTDIALSSATAGDICWGALTSATSSDANVSCGITGSATGTLTLVNRGASALDVATGTARVCYFGGF